LFEKGKPVSLSFSFQNETVKLFGADVPLGMAVVTCERTVMAGEDLQALREAIAANTGENIPVRFTPFEGAPMLAHYPAWLSPGDRDFLVGQLDKAATEAGQIIPGVSDNKV